MTDEERKFLQRLAEQVEANGKMTSTIYREIFEVPIGSDDKPLIEMIRNVVKAYQRASWVTRVVVWVLPTLAGLGIAVREIAKWLPGKGP